MTSSQASTNNKKNCAYGTWPSAISSELILSDSISLDEPILTKTAIYHLERRPQENGRCVIVKTADNLTIDLLPKSYSARSRVHEYGGGCYCVAGEIIYFVNDKDQNIYQLFDDEIIPVTRSDDDRFADIVYDDVHNRLIAVCENHNEDQVDNTLVSINIDDGEITTLVAGQDFYASPKLNADSTQLCWQSWSHPNMPWDGNQLWLAQLATDGSILQQKHIAGSQDISVFQPQWSPDNILYYISDNDGWWHIYRHNSDDSNKQLTQGALEFGLPQWVFSQSTYAFIDHQHIICQFQQNNMTRLALLELSDRPKLDAIASDFQHFSNLRAYGDRICFIASSAKTFPQLVTSTIDGTYLRHTEILKQSSALPIGDEHYSVAESMQFTNRHQQTVYANYYPPSNPLYHAEDDERPPLIVICHGGPTGQSNSSLDPRKQFWTSRGFALLDVNYSGSTGYGRDYRERLKQQWGILDVTDCCDAALYAVSKGLADKNRLIIRGSSAGGYTVLSALTFENIFSAGASYYGISELTSLASDTHKFESRYLDSLIGPYPEDEKTYFERSPINHTERLDCPVIFFQGLEDRVVPKEQATHMFDALSKAGVCVAAQYYVGEQHGFRKSKTIIQSLENELSFYKLVFELVDKKDIHFEGEIETSNF